MESFSAQMVTLSHGDIRIQHTFTYFEDRRANTDDKSLLNNAILTMFFMN